jgi:hypothetical protein
LFFLKPSYRSPQMHGPIEEHIEAATLENYSLQVSSREALEDVECHLQVCAVCRQRLQEIEPFNMAHFIRDGLIYSRITQLKDGYFWGQCCNFGVSNAGRVVR